MPSRRLPPVHWLAGLSLVPMLVWWLGWNPGFASSDTIDQWSQGLSGDYLNNHPPVHTLYLELMSLGNTRPGLVSLLQILALAGLLVIAAKWLVASGVPPWLAVGSTWVMGIAPAVATTTLALWKDVVFGLFVLWVWIELVASAQETRRWDRPWPSVRLGLALAGVWVFRGNGPITVLLLLIVLAWVHRRRLRRILVPALVTLATAFALTTPLAMALGVRGEGIDPSQVFLPDVAASFNAEPQTFSEADLTLLGDLAPLQVWDTRYDCYDSTPLLFDPAFDHGPLRADRGAYRDLVLEVFIRDPDSVIEHRVCAANFLYSPVQPEDAYFHRPPYDIPPNEVGLVRAPRSNQAFDVTDRIWRWSEGHLWLMWRPAIVLIPALLVAAALWAIRETRRLFLPVALFLIHLGNVALTSPAQELRYAYPLYLVAVLTLPLAYLVFRPGSRQAP